MKAHSPVIPGMEIMEVVYGAKQPEYSPLPVLKTSKGQLLMRFTLTQEEREAIAQGADIYISVLTMNQPLQPIMTAVGQPDEDLTERNLDIAKYFGIEV